MTRVKFTANRIESGAVVWLTGDLGWSEDAGKAHGFAGRLAEQAREAVDRSERGNAIIAAYEVPVEDGMPRPSAREDIRAARGPSILPSADRLTGKRDAAPAPAPAIAPAMYRYDAVDHELVRTRAAQFRDQVAAASRRTE